MKFAFDKPACQNIRKALRKEWLLTNGLGDYASSTIVGCNTRKYHGLLVVNLEKPQGRYVLLSTLEESVTGQGKEFFFSCRKHPSVYFPKGHEYLEFMESSDWPIFRYRIGQLLVQRELVLVRGKSQILARYTVEWDGDDCPPLLLHIKPLLAYRNFHQLSFANPDIKPETRVLPGGFSISPYGDSMPPLYMEVETINSPTAVRSPAEFHEASAWCNKVEYFKEQERGFSYQEDLFQPGVFIIPIQPGSSVLLSAGIKPSDAPLTELWEEETQHRLALTKETATLTGHLAREGARYLVTNPTGQLNVIAGYHWFDAWGRDSLIALPGLTFVAGRMHKGETLLKHITATLQNGMIPNMFSMDGNHAMNSVDASLWYVWAVQQMLIWAPEKEEFARQVCWPAIKSIIDAYSSGVHPGIYTDEEGMLHAGSAATQLTWMDAHAHGQPVTPRHGCPVEINALWYNALAFADYLATQYDEPKYRCTEKLRDFRARFRFRFWTPRNGGHLGDVWRDGVLDPCVRPNQIFAVSLPYSVLSEDDQVFVVENVRNNLLTPYGLRTLSPHDPQYEGHYEGGPDKRDAAYHQGTVWPWLLGAYGEALLLTSWDRPNAVRGLLGTLKPLFTHHLGDAGLGSISEIFDGNPPFAPDGCIAQAWSVAECYRLLRLLQQAEPQIYADWEAQVSRR